MTRRLGALLAALTLLVAASPVGAHVITGGGGNCNLGWAYFYGDDDYAPAGHPLKLCYGGAIPFLENIHDNDPGNCRGFGALDWGHWHDCISSVKTSVFDNSHSLCIYETFNYQGAFLQLFNNQDAPDLSTLNPNWDDRFDSIRWRLNADGC